MKKRREIHALDFAINQIVATLHPILFNSSVVERALGKARAEGASAEVLQKLKRLRMARSTEVEEKMMCRYLKGIEVTIDAQRSDWVNATIRPLGWPEGSFLRCNLYRGKLQHWEGEDVLLFIPELFQLKLLSWLVTTGWFPITIPTEDPIGKCDPVEREAFMSLIDAFSSYFRDACMYRIREGRLK